MNKSFVIKLIAAQLIIMPAMAHIGVDNHENFGFFSGFMHPLSGMDHMAVMLCVGLWSALTARRVGAALLWGPVGFASMLILGAWMGLQGLAVSAVEPMIAVSLLVTGLFVASRLHVPGVVAALIVGVFAIFHGLAHGYELAGSPVAFLTLAGMLAATILLHLTGLAMGWMLKHANVWMSRIAGGAVAIFGSLLLLQLI